MHRTKILLTVCFLCALAVLRIYGQIPASKLGYVRFWNMLPPANGKFDLRNAGDSAGTNLFSGTSYQYASYVGLAVGRYHLVVYKSGDQVKPLKSFDVDLKPESYFTVLMSPQAGAMNIELLQDTIDRKATTATLTVRNYFPGLTVAVSSGDKHIIDALAYGQIYKAEGLPTVNMPLTLRTKLPNGTPAESGAEADFRASKRATLLIIPDSYGRFRPRVTIDGRNL